MVGQKDMVTWGGRRQALPPAMGDCGQVLSLSGPQLLRGVGVHADPGGAVRASSELRDGWTRNGTAPCLSFPLLTGLKRKVCSLGWRTQVLVTAARQCE